MDISTTIGRHGAFTLEIQPLAAEQQNKVHQISIHLSDYLSLPMPFCEIRELPDWDRRIHIISDPDAQKLIESFHRYGPKVKTPENPCPFADGNIKKRFASLVGNQNLGTTYEGESERYRTALLKFFSPSRISKFETLWETTAKQWVADQIQRGEVELFDSTHRLVAQCLIEGMLGFKNCTAGDIDFNVTYWKQLFTPLPHQLKSAQELTQEGKPGLLQKGFNYFTDRAELTKSLWTYFVESAELKNLAKKIHQATVTDENSLCYYLHQNQFTETEILDYVKGILIAGQETTGYLLAFALYEYAKNPAMQAKHAQQPDEIKKAFLETLRLYSPGGAIREAGTDLVLNYQPQTQAEETGIPRQHFIRKGDMIACVPNLAGHNLPHWKNPEEFNCERENLERVNEIPHFGSGAHRCIGEKVAKNEIITLLSVILTHASLQTKDPLPELIDSFTLRPTKDMKIQFKSLETSEKTS